MAQEMNSDTKKRSLLPRKSSLVPVKSSMVPVKSSLPPRKYSLDPGIALWLPEKKYNSTNEAFPPTQETLAVNKDMFFTLENYPWNTGKTP